MSRKILGLEVRKDSVSAVLLEIGFKGSELLSQGHFPVPEGETDAERLQGAFKQMAAELKPSGTFCVLGISTDFISFRNLSVPFHDTKKIKQILPFELEPTLPMPVDELLIEFEAVKQEGHHDLLTFSIPKAVVQEYVDLLDSVNIRPSVIVPAGYAVTRLLSKLSAEHEDFLFIDTGASHHTVYAASEGVVRLVRSFPIAKTGVPVVRNLETNMKRTITAFGESSDISLDPATVFSAGPQSGLLGGERQGATFLERPISAIEAIRSFPGLLNLPDSPEWTTGQYDIALSLAMMEAEGVKGINFSSEKSTLSNFWSEYRGKIIATGTLLLLTLTTALGSQLFEVKRKAKELADLDQKIKAVFTDTFPDVTRIVDPLQQMQINLRETADKNVHPDLPGTHVRVIDILNTLSLQIPKSVDVKVNRMVVGTDNVLLSGNTNTFNTVDDIKSRLEESDLFTAVTISSADLERSGKRVRFKLKLDY
jgi:general secretion pathway protein L